VTPIAEHIQFADVGWAVAGIANETGAECHFLATVEILLLLPISRALIAEGGRGGELLDLLRELMIRSSSMGRGRPASPGRLTEWLLANDLRNDGSGLSRWVITDNDGRPSLDEHGQPRSAFTEFSDPGITFLRVLDALRSVGGERGKAIASLFVGSGMWHSWGSDGTCGCSKSERAGTSGVFSVRAGLHNRRPEPEEAFPDIFQPIMSYCAVTGAMHAMRRQLEWVRAPRVFTLDVYDEGGGGRRDIRVFLPEVLSFAREEGQEAYYDFSGCVIFRGGPHVVARVRTDDARWMELNDGEAVSGPWKWGTSGGRRHLSAPFKLAFYVLRQ
jgi:hypothetical protein